MRQLGRHQGIRTILQNKLKSVLCGVFFAVLLFSQVGTACPPPCGFCYIWNNNECVWLGDLWCDDCEHLNSECSGCIDDCQDGYMCVGDYCKKECEDNSDCDASRCMVCGSGGYCINQCLSGEDCINGACVPEATCSPACTGGKICVNDVCVDDEGGPCDPACNYGYSCINGSCVPDETCSPSCSEGRVCVNDECVPACSTGCNAAACESCNASTGSCEGCPDGYFCDEGTCKQGCLSDLECGGCEGCVNYVCEYDCADNQICEDDQCITICESDSDCGECESCSEDGECVYDCTDEQKCKNDACYDTCQEDSDCAEGQICSGGVCKAGCTEDSECSSGQVCRNGVCEKGCTQDSDCGENQACREGVCKDRCLSDSDCAEGQTCANGACKKSCDECGEDEECVDDQCQEGCSSDDDCPDNQTCVDGACQPDEGGGPCEDDTDCPEGQICSADGTCLPIDCTITGCPPGYECVDGTCQQETGCSVDGQCPEGYHCENGECIPDPECNQDSDCPEGCTCENGECVPDENFCPTIFELADDTIFIANNAGGSWSLDTTPAPVSNNTVVKLRAIVHIDLDGDGIGDVHYWNFDQTTIGNIVVYKWPECTSQPTILWKKIMPKMCPVASNDNDPWNTNYAYYTNVVANSNSNTVQCPHGSSYTNPGAGQFLGNSFGLSGGHSCQIYRGLQARGNEGNGCAIIEYDHTDNGSSWEITASTITGVSHYTVSITNNSVTQHTKGKYVSNTVSHLVYNTQSSERAYNRGVRDVVTRIVRKSSHNSPYIQNVESYAGVPWLYGSWSFQARDYIGFDCADLAQAAAYNAGLSGSYQNSANGLKAGRPAIGSANEPYTLVSGVLKNSDGSTANITIGTDIHIGDLVMLDFDGDGTADHTTILYSGSGLLSGIILPENWAHD